MNEKNEPYSKDACQNQSTRSSDIDGSDAYEASNEVISKPSQFLKKLVKHLRGFSFCFDEGDIVRLVFFIAGISVLSWFIVLLWGYIPAILELLG